MLKILIMSICLKSDLDVRILYRLAINVKLAYMLVFEKTQVGGAKKNRSYTYLIKIADCSILLRIIT